MIVVGPQPGVWYPAVIEAETINMDCNEVPQHTSDRMLSLL